MKHGVILSEAFEARSAASEALTVAIETKAKNYEQLRVAASVIDDVSSRIDSNNIAGAYAAFGEMLRIVALLVEWRAFVLDAGIDAGRFLNGAISRFGIWKEEYESILKDSDLLSAGSMISEISEITKISDLCKSMVAVRLPIPYFAADNRFGKLPIGEPTDERKLPVELAVAFLRFVINGVPASETHFLKPREAHDLEIEVRVSRWPKGATSLYLRPVTVESLEIYDFPTFQFEIPTDEPPHKLRQTGRAVLKIPQSIHSRPFEFKYAAEFFPYGAEQPIAVVGQRTLRIESIDLQSSPITGYSDMDQKLLSVRDSLRSQRLADNDLRTVLILMRELGGIACRALHDDLYPGVQSESQFQKEIRAELRRSPEIASELEEHPKAAGGITDLSFRGVRIELKAEAQKAVTPESSRRFHSQTATYTVATGKRIGILCILDCSPKNTHPFPAEEGLFLESIATNDGYIHIVTLIIQGNLPRPSDLSR